MKQLSFLFVFIAGIIINAQASPISVTFSTEQGAFPLVSSGQATQIVVDPQDPEVVTIAANAFKGDIQLLTNREPAVVNTITANRAVIIGTLNSSFINQLVTAGKIDKTKLEGKWETFCIAVVDNPIAGVNQALVIAGSDPRGTAFGVFELTRMMGVSPWVWWADVTPESREEIYIAGNETFGPPSVQYRGMFINDEDWGMQPWAAKNMDPTINGGRGDIGPRTHERIFELMLRTKSNYFWPGMHPSTKAFWYYKENPEVARRYQIVMGASHCEPMLRNNEDEWNRNFSTEFPGVTRGSWNWRTNSTVIKNYWIERVKEAVNNEAIYTMGMRGVHDSQMEGYDNDRDRAVALKDIIATQRDILETHLGKPKATVPQLFCPYKEALNHYNQGIDLPDDITLLWPDDNHGYIRQLSTPAEQARNGGGGVYYHFSYWGIPSDFLWLSSISPSLTSFEMTKAYELNAKKIWIFNVGDLKPAEFEYQFAMDLAWDINAWSPEKAHLYSRFWAVETFGEDVADEIASIKERYFQLAASGKPEHIYRVDYSTAEMERRIAEYTALVVDAKSLEARIPTRLKDAYFQLIKYPVLGASAMNEKILGAKLSFEYAKQGNPNKAIAIANRAQEAYREIRDLTNTYNKVQVDGKWDGMMDYAPRGHDFFYNPNVVTDELLYGNSIPPATPDDITLIPANNFFAKNEAGKTIETITGLGVAGTSVTVWPFDMTSYEAPNISSAPHLEYKITVKKGHNLVRVKCLPTFPLYPGLKLRYAISVDNNTPQFINIAYSAESGGWSTNVLRGYASGSTAYQSDSDKEISVKVYFADPGVVLSALEVVSPSENTLADKMVNPDFEYDEHGNQLDGTTKRGDPYGWTHTGDLIGVSFGTNNDAANYHGSNLCWYNSEPTFPATFELSQTIEGLPAGEYVLRCQLGVANNMLTTQRLFANNYVQYYGKESEYANNKTQGETNTFAGHNTDSGEGSGIFLNEMAVRFIVMEGESVKIGIRSGNKKGNGTAANNRSGWFKVDNFRLESIREFSDQAVKTQLDELIAEALQLYNTTEEGIISGKYPAQARATFIGSIQSAQAIAQNTSAELAQLVSAIEELRNAIRAYQESMITFTSSIINPSFEYKSAGVINDGSTVRGTPYGWSDTGGLGGESWGINNDAANKDGNNVCWYNSFPMPNEFELYQNIAGLPAGEYIVSCRLALERGRITTQHLFANNSKQYYGYESDYALNITDAATSGFANWSPPAGSFLLQDMEVPVTIQQGETLKLGIRTSNINTDGTRETSSNNGWFKVDHFRLELKELHEQNSLTPAPGNNNFCIIRGGKSGCEIKFTEPYTTATIQIYSLLGSSVYNNKENNSEKNIALTPGIYIVRVTLDGKEKTEKIIVK